jgi:uncharacterized protein YlzI (FlbEa/FlbD family)
MLLTFKDSIAGLPVHINPTHIVGVFCVADGEHKGRTAITLVNGNVVVEESEATVVGTINTALINSCCK